MRSSPPHFHVIEILRKETGRPSQGFCLVVPVALTGNQVKIPILWNYGGLWT